MMTTVDGGNVPASSNCISPTELLDPAASHVSRTARVLVFVVLCQGVQMFMSYDGGAVPASLVELQKKAGSHPWSEFELGLLGSMDKIGMVVASVPWGWSLQRFNAKLLMAVSLFLNAGCTLAFGFLREKSWMYLAKFLIGVTQALQGVWSTVWTVTMAPPDRKTMWFGLGAVSAGLGNGIGYAVAGFGTANGLPYAFAFQLASGVLGVCWIALLFFPASWLRIRLPTHEEDARANEVEETRHREDGRSTDDATSETSPASSPATLQDLKNMMNNKVYLWTALAISLTMFEVSAIQFLWNRAFTEILPGLNINFVTLMSLVVSGAGGGVGIAFGPWFIDSRGGFGSPPGVIRTIKVLWYFQLVAALAGGAGVGCLYGKFHTKQHDTGEWGDEWLWMLWISIFVVIAAQNACVAALCGINVEVIPEPSRAFASGTEMTVRNVLGYMCGPLLPALVMSLNSGSEKSWQLALGLGFVLAVNAVGIGLIGACSSSATRFLADQQQVAFGKLRLAFQAQDAVALRRAVDFAKRVDLEVLDDGRAVVGMANQAIGQLCAGQGLSQTLVLTGDQEELHAHASQLEQTVTHQEGRIRRQHLELERLRGLLS
ncbi:unnamed protein product [Polarella glacialis]|uniref:Major facilitator superfamily (MFS) profile domain-containing protein n=1 Tax=Polarella glacialis TaxID=89957 RepID=A0A813K0T0_POLGL|nr:unnamed protein product [Polarella glacialis]